jgi:hypothetical protein
MPSRGQCPARHGAFDETGNREENSPEGLARNALIRLAVLN